MSNKKELVCKYCKQKLEETNYVVSPGFQGKIVVTKTPVFYGEFSNESCGGSDNGKHEPLGQDLGVNNVVMD